MNVAESSGHRSGVRGSHKTGLVLAIAAVAIATLLSAGVAANAAPPDDTTVTSAPDTPATDAPAPDTTSPSDDSSTTEPAEPATSEPEPEPEPEPAPPDFELVPLCTSQADFGAGTRTFHVHNNGDAAVQVTLTNTDTGQSVSGTASPGVSTWSVPAGSGTNTTALVVDGDTVTSSASSNVVCLALDANAECNTTNGEATLTWVVSNNDSSSAVISGDSRGLRFNPNPIPPLGSATAVETLSSWPVDQVISNTVTVQPGDGQAATLSASVTVPACTGPPFAEEVTFTFTTTADVASAVVGETVQYSYCGQNTSAIPLEVVRLVDDRLGVVLEDTATPTIVQPGATLCNTDLGLPVSYEVTPADADTTIVNNAVVTVRTLESPPRTFQASASTTVDVPSSKPLLRLLLQDATDSGKVKICHATGADDHWTTQEVAPSAAAEGGHHNRDDHQGGRDIIPPGPWDPDGRNWGDGGDVIWASGCVKPKTAPIAPIVVEATCAAGVVTEPQVLTTETTGIRYTLTPPGPYSGDTTTTVVVTATLQPGFEWGQIPSGWTKSGSTYRYTVTLTAVSCSAVTPVSPTVIQSACVAGVDREPALLLPTTDGVTYTFAPMVRPGAVVTVTATLDPTGVSWAPTLPVGWVRVDDTTATFLVYFDDAACVPAAPVAPAVTLASCVSGEVTDHSIVEAAAPEGVVYALVPTPPWPGTEDATVTVWALAGSGLKWDQMPPGWTVVDPLRATYTVELVGASCDEVTPVAPTVTQAVCADGAVTEPDITFPSTDNVTYSSDPEAPFSPGSTVVVTATLDDAGVGWSSTLPPGWTLVDATHATFTVTLADATCTPVSPTNPVVVPATCTGGAVTEPMVVLPGTEGIVYSAEPGPPYDGTKETTVTVTAILDDGFEWGQIPAGWRQVDAVTATHELVLHAASCDVVTPAAPSVIEAQCVGGVVTAPEIELARTDGITYTADPAGPYAAGDTVTVTATLADSGVGWPEELPAGWTAQSSTTATYTVTFDRVSCRPVSPAAPLVEQAACRSGVVVAPTITLPSTMGISYRADPQGPYTGTDDHTVYIIATVSDGYGWGQLPPGWSRFDDTTATYTVQLTGASCDEVVPVTPVLVQAECVTGAVTAPTLTLGTADGVTHTADPEGPYSAGDEVTVTATLDPVRRAWAAELPDGWVVQSPTTALFGVKFDEVSCTPVSPVTPAITQASCVNGTVVAPSISLPVTTGIIYRVDPPGPYEGSEDTTVTVTATLVDGYEWGDLPEGWEGADTATATLEVTLIGTTCDEVTPVAPTVEAAVCVNGAVTAPTLTLATTDGVTYSADPAGPYAAGDTVTITAVLDDEGVGWADELPDGWTREDDTTATFQVDLAQAACIEVTLASVTVIKSVCIDGVAIAPTFELPNTPGVTYVVTPTDVGVVITATLADGFGWATPIGEGWTRTGPTTATFPITLEIIECETSELLVGPGGSEPERPTSIATVDPNAPADPNNPTAGVDAQSAQPPPAVVEVPVTGPANLARQLAVASALMLAGFLALGAGRRRRPTD